MTLANRQDVFRYVINNFSAYYDSVDIVQDNDEDGLILSSHDDAPYFNFCIHKDGKLEDCIARYLPMFKKYHRTPLIYVSPASSYYCEQIEFEKISDDAFMFLEDESILSNYPVPDSIKVELTEDEDLFIKIWGDSRRDPNDIYGVASEAMVNGMRHFFKPPKKGFSHFATMAYKDEKPVANVVSVYNKDWLLVIGLGTLPEYRKQGLGTVLMKDIIERAHKLGIKTITLQTETGTYNEKYYEKIGFVTRFNGVYYKP
ncbi:MAG: GNAT family N-acetyltransferase [Proteobacteria bacterium]|nr:GNAT family N-acetyltransferase [Pseudomonadota bacterium]